MPACRLTLRSAPPSAEVGRLDCSGQAPPPCHFRGVWLPEGCLVTWNQSTSSGELWIHSLPHSLVTGPHWVARLFTLTWYVHSSARLRSGFHGCIKCPNAFSNSRWHSWGPWWQVLLWPRCLVNGDLPSLLKGQGAGQIWAPE